MKNMILLAGLAAMLPASGCSLEGRVPVDMASMEQSHPLGNETSLQADIRLDIGSLEISGERTQDLYSVNLEYDKASYEPEISYEEGAGGEGRMSFRLQSSHRTGIRSERQTNRLRFGFTDAIPLSLRINTGVGDARLSLSSLRLRSLELESGVGGAKLSAFEPNPEICDSIRLRNGVGSLDAVGLGNLNFRSFEFEGGVGGASLDFSGDWKQSADVSIKVGIGGVTAHLPREIGVRVIAEKHFLSGLQLEGFRKESEDSYYSQNYDNARIRVTVNVKTGVGGFHIDWI